MRPAGTGNQKKDLQVKIEITGCPIVPVQWIRTEGKRKAGPVDAARLRPRNTPFREQKDQ